MLAYLPLLYCLFFFTFCAVLHSLVKFTVYIFKKKEGEKRGDHWVAGLLLSATISHIRIHGIVNPSRFGDFIIVTPFLSSLKLLLFLTYINGASSCSY